MSQKSLTPLGMIVTIAATYCAFVAGSVWGGEVDVGGTDQSEVPSFLVEVVVTPASGPMHIPPADPPSKPFTALIRISDSEVGGAWTFPRRIFYVGDAVEKEGTYGPYTITCTVTIDDHGQTAQVRAKAVRYEGETPTQIIFQSFTANLPASQILDD